MRRKTGVRRCNISSHKIGRHSNEFAFVMNEKIIQ